MAENILILMKSINSQIMNLNEPQAHTHIKYVKNYIIAHDNEFLNTNDKILKSGRERKAHYVEKQKYG